jgi:hypothetical protein
MSGIGNENFLTGGTGAALFGGAGSGADAKAKATAHQVTWAGQRGHSLGFACSGADAKAKATAHQVTFAEQGQPSSEVRAVGPTRRPRLLLTR